MFESDQTWAAGKPEVIGVQLALKERGRCGLKVKGEEEPSGGWGRVDEVFKGFQRMDNSPSL